MIISSICLFSEQFIQNIFICNIQLCFSVSGVLEKMFQSFRIQVLVPCFCVAESFRALYLEYIEIEPKNVLYNFFQKSDVNVSLSGFFITFCICNKFYNRCIRDFIKRYLISIIFFILMFVKISFWLYSIFSSFKKNIYINIYI